MWQIAHQCPQCGAPAILEETERLFSCPYCKVKLLIATREGLTYHLDTPGVGDDVLYLPYRRSRGIEFICTTLDTRASVVDRTVLARAGSSFPRSLGVRPQALRLRFVGGQTKGRFVAPDISQEEDDLPQSRQAILPGWAAERVPPTVSIRRFLSEAGSVIYAPFRLLGNEMYDAISMEIVEKTTERVEGSTPVSELPLCLPTGGGTFIPALCPNCGMDLQGDKESMALPCTNCALLWELSGNALSPRPLVALARKGAGERWYLPFWCVRGEAKGIDAPFRMNPLKTSKPADRTRPISFVDFRFWIPAFTLNPTLFLRLAERATVWGPAASETAPLESGEERYIYPVTLPSAQVTKLLPIILSLIVDQREARLLQMVKGTIEAAETSLLFVPFMKGPAEVYREDMRISLMTGALKYGRSL